MVSTFKQNDSQSLSSKLLQSSIIFKQRNYHETSCD